MTFAYSCFKSQPTRIPPDTPCQNTWDLSKGMILTVAGGLRTPPRGAGGVREFTNYGSLWLVGEGCSQHGEPGCFSRTPFRTPPDAGEVNRNVGFSFQPSGVTVCC